MHMKHKKLTITIGIPAYNEEQNIAQLLQSLLNQRQENITIEKIIVLSDGSTDRTVALTRSFSDTRIQVIENKTQKGKSVRLNDLFRLPVADVLVVMDADVLPATETMLENLCRPFLDPAFRGFVSGKRIPLPSKTLTGIAVNNINLAYDIVREELAHGNNIYSFLAGAFAFHRSVVKTLRIPPELHSDDNYLYLSCKQSGVPLRYVTQAGMYFRTPQTIGDQIRQGGRFISSPQLLSRYFDPALIHREFLVPLPLRVRILWYQLCHNPIAYVWLKILSILCQWEKIRYIVAPAHGTWKIAETSKKLQ